MLADLALLQRALVLEGFFVRGAASIGPLYIDTHVVFGAAAVDAYEAEQKAVTPRIILHESAQQQVIQELTYYHATYGERHGHRFTDAVLVDEDGRWFINYLHEDLDSRLFERDYSWLKQHRDIIRERLVLFRNNEHVRQKYLWAAQYHNYFCASTDGCSPYMLDSVAQPLVVTEIEDAYTKP